MCYFDVVCKFGGRNFIPDMKNIRSECGFNDVLI